MKIRIERTFQIFQYQPETIVIEYDTEIDKDCDEKGLINKLRSVIESSFVSRYPHLKELVPDAQPGRNNRRMYDDIIQNKEQRPNVTNEKVIIAEMEAFSLSSNVFERVYKNQVAGNPKLQSAYDKKLKELK